jgi:hypothetical protein
MATLILTAVGSAIGGPIGGALGSLIGGTIDRAVLAAPGKREGPRLTELAVQTSSYGSQIPKLFGTTRVAGTVIWSTDLIESRATASAGKGQPSVTTYSYAASFAVLLSARPILSVGRIWADGNLLRGSAGDWKAATGFRLHLGGEDQDPDPLIASAVGAGLAPAHRGGAYAVFENLQLAAFGNRLPSLTFEVVADDGAVAVGTVAAALAPEVSGAVALTLGGFAASGGSAGAVIETLARASGAWLAPAGDGLALCDATTAGPAAAIADPAVATAGHAAPRTRSIAAAETVPRTLSVSYYDPARDYQAGVQQARRPGAGETEQRLEMPAVIDAATAKGIARAALARADTARTTRTVALGLDGLIVAPGSCVAIAGEPGVWRVLDSTAEGYAVTLTLSPLAAATLPGPATSGQVLAAPDRPIGATILQVMELPGLDDQPLSAPRVTVVANGTGEGWRRAALLLSTDDGASWSAAGATAAPAVLGTLAAALPPAPSTLFDEANSLDVLLAHPGMVLGDADDGQLDGGANLAVAGEELIQFGRAMPLGAGRWRLSRLLRGRRGTEAASGGQVAGDRFVLLEPDAARTLDLPLAAIGARVRIMASGVGDAAGPVEAVLTVTGRSVVPPSPVHLTARDEADGGATLNWVRRSRAGWRWVDGIDAPLAEEGEVYALSRIADGGTTTTEIPVATAAIAAADRAAGAVTVGVVQRGTYGASSSASLLIAPSGVS